MHASDTFNRRIQLACEQGSHFVYEQYKGRSFHTELPQAIGVALADSSSLWLLQLMDIDRIHACNAPYRRIDRVHQ